MKWLTTAGTQRSASSRYLTSSKSYLWSHLPSLPNYASALHPITLWTVPPMSKSQPQGLKLDMEPSPQFPNNAGLSGSVSQFYLQEFGTQEPVSPFCCLIIFKTLAGVSYLSRQQTIILHVFVEIKEATHMHIGDKSVQILTQYLTNHSLSTVF